MGSWWVREARTLPGPSPPTGRIGRLAQTRPPGEEVSQAGHGHHGQVGGGTAGVSRSVAAQLPGLLQELGMEPVLQWPAPGRTVDSDICSRLGPASLSRLSALTTSLSSTTRESTATTTNC